MKKIILSLLIIGIMLPVTANAQFTKAKTQLDEVNKSGTGTGLSDNFNVTISTIIKGALSILGTIFLVLMIYAGILWMTAQGNEEKVKKATDIITAAIIGLAITLSAYAITAFVTTKLGAS